MNSIDLGLLVLRIVAGLVFAAHGAQKTFGWWSGPGLSGWRAAMERMGIRPAGFWAVVSALTELIGGVLLVFGLFTPLAAALAIGQAIVIIERGHWRNGFWNGNRGFEFPLTLAATFVTLAITGPGAISLDGALGLAYDPVLRVTLVIIAVVGGIVAAALPRVQPQQTSTPQPR